MARPTKAGLDYFPVQTDIGSDPKIKRLIRRGNKDAWVVFSWMLPIIYHEGYYIEADTLIEMITWDFRDVDEEAVCNSLSIMADLDLINKELYEQERIVTSRGIQKQYLRSTNRRSDVDIEEYWVVSANNNGVSANNNGVSVDNNSVSVCKSTQTETETETENKKKINKTETETESITEPVFSDSFQSSFSDSVIDRLKDSGVDVKRNTLQLIDEMTRKYDERSIDEALDMSIAGYRTGEVKSVVGFMKTILENWAIGKGCPKWVEQEEQRLQKEKEEHMKPGALAGMF